MLNNQFALTDSIKAIDSEMAELQAKIDKLEAQKSVLNQAEKVCIEALQAINNAVAVLNEVDPAQVAIFGEFIAAKFVEFATPVTEPEAQAEPEAQTATLEELKKLSIQTIRKLAAKKSAGGSGTRAEIAGRLAGLVTTAELKALG